MVTSECLVKAELKTKNEKKRTKMVFFSVLKNFLHTENKKSERSEKWQKKIMMILIPS